jgi:hypothetical protein
MYTGVRWESQKDSDPYENLHAGGRIMSKRISEKQDGMVRTGFIWLKTFAFHETLGNSSVAKRLVAF